MTIALSTTVGNPLGIGEVHTCQRLSPSARHVLDLLIDEKSYCFSEIAQRASCTPRTVRNALGLLRKRRLVIAKFNIRDGRQVLYQRA